MFGYHLFGAEFGSFGEGQWFFAPRRGDQTGFSVLFETVCALCHYRLAGTGLRQFVRHYLFGIAVLHVGNDKFSHKLFYKRGFARTDRPHHPYVDISAASLGDVLVNVVIKHYPPPQNLCV